MTNVFSGLPWDMKREISTYLQRDDGANFNEVLCRDERVYKKFPKDFALKHALCVLKEEHNSIIRRVGIFRDLEDRYDRAQLRSATNCMFRFCMNPRSEIAFMYQGGVKEQLIRFIAPWLDEDHYGYIGVKPAKKETLLGNARWALEIVSKTPFIRHIVT
jgi:hypothetical protein